MGLLLVAPATTQQQDPPPPTLEITSGNHDLVWEVARSLAGVDFMDLEIPELQQGEQLRLVLVREKVSVRAVPAGEHILEVCLRGKPEVLGKVVEEWSDPAARILHMTAFMTLTARMQMEGRHAAQAMRAATRFHHQFKELHLTVKKTEDSANAYAVDLWVTPREATWLAEVVDGIQPGKAGAPHLRSPNATLQVTAAAQGKGLRRFLEPFADQLGLIRGRTREERKRFRALARGRLEHFDGCFGLMIDGPGRYIRMVGLTRPKDYGKLTAQKAVQAFDCRRAGQTDVVLAAEKDLPPALAGSGLRVLLKEIDPFALTEEQQGKEARQDKINLTTFAGVVEDFSIKARLPAEGKEMAGLVERVRQKRLRRMPLPEGALVRARINLGLRVRLGPDADKDLQEALKPYEELLGGLWRKVPETFDVAVFKRAEKLHVRVATR